MKVKYQKGEDLVRDMRVRNALSGNVLFDPDEIVCEARPPTGEAILFRWPSAEGYEDLERLSEGKFRVKIAQTEAGTWRRQWRSYGPDFNEFSAWTSWVVDDDPA